MAPLKAESAAHTIAASAASSAPRSFLVGFYVRSVGAKTWEADILVSSLDAQQWTIGSHHQGTIHFVGTSTGKLSEIIYSLAATSAADALKTAYADLMELIDDICLRHGRSIEVVGWRVADTQHAARWRCVPFLSSAVLGTAERHDIPGELRALVRLYREARCASTPMWRFISAAAILDKLLGGGDTAAVGHNPITVDMLVRSGAYGVVQLVDVPTAAALRDHIAPKRQACLAMLQGVAATSAAAGAAAFDDAVELAAIANLTDLVARNLLLDCINRTDPAGAKVASPQAQQLAGFGTR
jgi:hypothetical protein